MFYEAGDPRCSSAGRRRLIFCQFLLAPLYAARQCYKNRRCGTRRSCLWLELWIRRLSLTSDSFLALVIPPALRNEVTAVEACLPQAGLSCSAPRRFPILKFSFRRFFDFDSNSNPSHPSRRRRGEERGNLAGENRI